MYVLADARKNKNMKRAIFTISLILIIKMILFAQAPVANFTCTVDTCSPPYCVFQFTDMSTNNPTNWEWIVCDGASYTVQNPTHFVNYMATVCVYLVATNSYGSDTAMCYYTVDSTGCYCCSTSTEIESTLFQENNVYVFPNPTTTELHIKVRGVIKDSYTVTMYDTQGKTVDIITTNEQETEIDISKYPQGVYWVRILGNNIVRNEKIIKLMTN